MFCLHCGEQLPNRARYCFMCGEPIYKSDRDDKIAKTPQPKMLSSCPNCGSSIGRLDAVCPYCGFEIVGREAAKAVRDFAEDLARIESEAEEDQGTGLMKILGFGQLMEKGFGNKAFERKLSLIRSFPIPNTIEEIAEFVMLAAANIDVRFAKDSYYNRIGGKPGGTYYTEITIAKAWVSKLEQAYQKALISFPDNPIFPKIEKIYLDKMEEIKKK